MYPTHEPSLELTIHEHGPLSELLCNVGQYGVALPARYPRLRLTRDFLWSLTVIADNLLIDRPIHSFQCLKLRISTPVFSISFTQVNNTAIPVLIQLTSFHEDI